MNTIFKEQTEQETKPYGALKDFNLSEVSELVIDTEFTVENTRKELVAVNDNNFPTLPTDPKALPSFITIATKAVEAESNLLKGLVLNPYKYKFALQQTQKHASLLLEAQLRLSDALKGIKTQRGMRTDLKSKANKMIKSKKDIIANDYNLTPRQARDIEKLTKESVKAAVIEALDNNEIPTRSLALSKLDKKPSEDREHFDLETQTEDDDKTLNLDKQIRYTSLFANVGIGTYYLKDMGLECAVANEIVPDRVKWHRSIYKTCETIEGNIQDPTIFEKIIKAHKEKGCELLLASPVCKDFSRANTSASRMTSKRTALFINTLDFIKATKPKWVMIENVPDFLFMKPKSVEDVLLGKTIGEYLKEELETLGYKVNIGVFSAADYGTAQDRTRGIILASQTKLWNFPKKDKFRKMLFDVIGDLPSLEPGQSDPERPLHYALPLPQCQIDFLSHTPTGCSAWQNAKKYQPVNIDGKQSGAQFKSSFMRKDWSKPSNTILTDNSSIGGMVNIHPGRPLSNGTYSDCRPFSILELLRISGLPDNYPIPIEFKNNDNLIREVIGECFLPLHVKALLSTLPIPANDNVSIKFSEIDTKK